MPTYFSDCPRTQTQTTIQELFSMIILFALLYLQSDSTTVPLAAAKLRGLRDAF